MDNDRVHAVCVIMGLWLQTGVACDCFGKYCRNRTNRPLWQSLWRWGWWE